MPLYHSDAFVLRTYKVGETDQIVVFFTRELGKIRAVVRRSHRWQRHTAGYYQPLMLLRVILFGYPQRALYRVNTVDVRQAFRPLHEDFDALRRGLYMTELLDVTTREREPLPEIFTLFTEALTLLQQMPASFLPVCLFEMRLLAAIGYTPQLSYCVRCSQKLHPQDCTFSPSLGGLLCTACAAKVVPAFPVTPATLAYLRRALADTSKGLAMLPCSAAMQQELENLLHAHLVARLGRELKSYPFLHL